MLNIEELVQKFSKDVSEDLNKLFSILRTAETKDGKKIFSPAHEADLIKFIMLISIQKMLKN